MDKRIYIETYGCQMNVVDSEVIFAIMAKDGYERTESMDEADIILANTCSVRDNAEQRIWGRLEEFRKRKERRPEVIVGIVGCMAERLKDKLILTGKVDLVAGPDTYRTLPEMVRDITPDKPGINVLLSREETYGDIMPVRTDKNGVSAFISIMRGCNNVCSYCVVPYTRGAERSRDPETILDEARDVFSRGYKEVTLLGQNVDSYLWTGPGGEKMDFPGLLAAVAGSDPSLRVRFATNHPKDISDSLLETMAAHENICKHIHLPVQSGSDRLLEKMRRRYTREWYMERVRKIREILPGCGITTDVIAGFCSETEEDHQATLSLFREAAFDYAYMFCYSERPGTLASRKYPDDVPPEVKTRRLNEIIDLQNQLSLESNRRDVGKVFEVLVEGPSRKNPEELRGRAGSDKMCVFPGNGHKAGEYVQVEITSCTSATLLGRVVE